MQYKNSIEFAKEWNLSPRTVRNFCANDKIPGAVYAGKQWLIPSDASKPIDMRCKNAKLLLENEFYHFPVFIYSTYYSHPQDLSEYERELLKAQSLHLKGDYYQSISICRELLSLPIPGSLVSGIYCTLGFSAICLGIYSTYKDAISKLEKMSENTAYHKEDIKLMTVALITHIRWEDFNILEKIDYSQLSFDAMFFYRYLLLMRAFFTGTFVNDTIFKFFQSELMYIENEKITPAVFVYSCLLGTGKIFNISKQQKEVHLKRAIQIATENKWLPSLVKFYVFEKKIIGEILKGMNKRYLTTIDLYEKNTIPKWYIVKKLETGSEIGLFMEGSLGELILLVSYGFTYAQIANLKGLAMSDLGNQIHKIYEIANVHTITELKQYGKRIFNQIE